MKTELMMRVSVVLAALALTGCQGGSSEPEPLLPPGESVDHYNAVLDDVASVLEEAYPDATVGVEDEPATLGLQDDGECVLFLPKRTIDVNLFLENKDTSLEVLQSALEEHGFGDLTDVEQAGPERTSHAEDARGAEFRANDRNSSDVSIRVPVHSGSCSPDDLPAS